MRGHLLGGRRVQVQGIARAGVVRFTRTEIVGPDGPTTFGPTTHLSMDLGIGFEFRPASRWAPRVDFLNTLYVVNGVRVFSSAAPGGPIASTSVHGKVADTFQVSAGVRYRPNPRATGGLSRSGERFSAGPLFTYAAAVNVAALTPIHNIGPGGFVSARVSDHIYVDAALCALLRHRPERTPWDGGRVVQALVGVKMGSRRGAVGYFVKARGGVNSHDDAFRGRERPRVPLTGRSNVGIIDVGGVLELDLGSQILLRIDAGSVMSIYGSRTIVIEGVTLPQGRQSLRPSIQFSVGSGWTF